MGSVPETDGFSLNSHILLGRGRVVSVGLGLPLGGEVLEVTELHASVCFLKREAGQGLTLAVTERSQDFTSRSVKGWGRVSDRLGNRNSRSGFVGWLCLGLNHSVGFPIVILRSHASQGSQRVSTKIGDDSTSVLTKHTLLARDDATLLDDSTRFVQDDGLDSDSLVVTRGQLKDSQAMLLEQGLEVGQVAGEVSELGLEMRIEIVGKDVLRLGDESDESLVDGDLLFRGVLVVVVVHDRNVSKGCVVHLVLSMAFCKTARIKCERVAYLLLDTLLRSLSRVRGMRTDSITSLV